MRHLIIRVSGSNRTIKVKIRPGTTSKDIFEYLGLSDYVLAPASAPLEQFLPEMDIYPCTRNGQRLIAMTEAEAVDRFVRDVVFGSGDL
jgi:hypothetical protein